MSNEIELENLRLKIMDEINKRFEEVLHDLNENGSEFSRNIKLEILELRDNTKKEIEELWSWSKSQLLSIKQGQQMMYDPKDGLITIALRKVQEAVKMAQDSALCTIAAQKASEKAEMAADGAKQAVDKVWIAILLPVIGSAIIWLATQFWIAGPKQDALVKEMKAKLEQDAKNQVETIGMLNELKKELSGGLR
jgi:hypothetical protein